MSDIVVTPINNGPYRVVGKIQIVTEGGRVIESEGEENWLCRCGQSSHKPFCDGTHESIGFQADLDAPVEAPVSTGAPSGEGFADAAADADVIEGEILAVDVDEQPIVLTRVRGQICALFGVCTHQEAMLDGGEIDGDVLMCPVHDSGFNVFTGAATKLPATQPLPTYDVKVENGRVLVARQPRQGGS